MDGELRRIKKLYGEDFAKFCRSAFSRILEEEGLLTETLKRAFPPTHGLYKALVDGDNLQDFKNHIYYRAGYEKYEPREVYASPEQLMLSSDYSLYKCERVDDIMQFVRYYDEDELLCTFDDIEGRLEDCDVFFAVRFDADELDRKDFKNPKREDAYGTSVISIQFDKSDGTVSIKNRYNHAVDNPDATFSNDLDNICPGLTDSFATHYGLYSKIDYEDYEEFYSDEFVKTDDNKYFHISRCEGDVHICDENWVVIDGKATYYDKSRYEIFDFFILDKQEKRIFSAIDYQHDSFVDEFENIKKIDIVKSGSGKIIHVTKNDDTFFEVQISKDGTITGYENNFQTEIGDSFLSNSYDLEYVSIPKAKMMGERCFTDCNKLQSIDMPELEQMGGFCLPSNKNIIYINLPKVKKIGANCFTSCGHVQTLNLPEVEDIGGNFMRHAHKLKELYMPKLKYVGPAFLRYARNLKTIELPELVDVGDFFMDEAESVKRVSMPKLKNVGNYFLSKCYSLTSAEFPELLYADSHFMYEAIELQNIEMPKISYMGHSALRDCENLKKLEFPELKNVGYSFVTEGRSVEYLNMPKLEVVGPSFLSCNKILKELNLPCLLHAPKAFLSDNTDLEVINLPQLKVVEDNFMINNLGAAKINFPELETVGHAFFMNNEEIREVHMPKLKEVGVFFLGGSMDNLVVVDIPNDVKGLPMGIKDFIVQPGEN